MIAFTIHFQQIGQAWWYTPVIPATQQEEVAGLQSETSSGQKQENLSEK
jgi:hypothetical protein